MSPSPLPVVVVLAFALAASAAAQRPVTRADAITAAVATGPRLAVARADTAAAFAQLVTARLIPDPLLAAGYSKDPPQYHAAVDIPLDLPWLRQPRIAAADAMRLSAQHRFAFARAAAALDADTTYTRALAAREHARLSRRNARDADSLRRMAIARREAGDASDLEVELATVSAGQQANIADADSLSYVSTLLDLQSTMGISSNDVAIAPTDSLVPPIAVDGDGDAPPVTLEVAAAEQAVSAAGHSVRLQRRTVWGAPGLIVGFDAHEPGVSNAILPQFGITLPLPLFGRNRGAIAQAESELARARAELALALVEGETRIARARRERDIAMSKVRRDQLLVASAGRVAAMALTAYREGESSLPNVLEAQRNARDVFGQYIDDVAQAHIATAALRVYTLAAAGAVR